MKTDLAPMLRTIEPDRRAECAIDLINAESRTWARRNRPPRSISAREALIALEFEALVVMVAAGNIAQGLTLTEEDRQRCLLAYSRIDTIVSEIA